MLPSSRYLIFLISFFVFIAVAPAFQMQPVGTEYDRKLAKLDESKAEKLLVTIVDRGSKIFVDPVHEEITHRICGCNDNWEDKATCAKKVFSSKALIDGTRWNDNPPFRVEEGFQLPNGKTIKSTCVNETIKLPRKSDCWKAIFEASSEKAGKKIFSSRNGVLLNRSHFGDMQFLHSMASRVGDRAKDTKLSILIWAEFAYKVASGKIPANTMLKNVKDVPDDFTKKFFPNQEMTVENLFLMGDETYRGEQLKDFAFGTLLHMVQDSFCESHVSRDLKTQRAFCDCPYADHLSPAKIEKFLVYSSQDAKKHEVEDTYKALTRDVKEYSPNVIDVGKVLKRFYDQKSDWDEVKKYLDECVFALKDPDAEADAGNFEAD